LTGIFDVFGPENGSYAVVGTLFLTVAHSAAVAANQNRPPAGSAYISRHHVGIVLFRLIRGSLVLLKFR